MRQTLKEKSYKINEKWNNIFYGHFFLDKKIQQENKPLIKILTEIIHLKTVKYVYIKERK